MLEYRMSTRPEHRQQYVDTTHPLQALTLLQYGGEATAARSKDEAVAEKFPSAGCDNSHVRK